MKCEPGNLSRRARITRQIVGRSAGHPRDVPHVPELLATFFTSPALRACLTCEYFSWNGHEPPQLGLLKSRQKDPIQQEYV